MLNDAELLRRHTEEKSEAAFAELVGRHLDLVYSTALRRVGGDTHRAQDVAQDVFTALARKARSLTAHPVLVGWLYTATQHAAAQSVRAEVRRQAREKEAHAMNETMTPPDASSAADWDRVRPVLDAAMAELNARDREAVLLRFFAQQPFAAIGSALGLSEDTARMRVQRALDKLHGALARRGVTSTASALGLALSTHSVLAAPAGLAGSIAGTALASGVAAGGALGGWVAFMGMNKAATLGLTALAGVIALNLAQQRTNAGLLDEFRALAGESQKLGPQRAENARLAAEVVALVSTSADADELARLRAQRDRLKKKYEDERPYMSIGGRSISRSTPPDEQLEIRYREGRSSPMRSWQTMQELGRPDNSLLRPEDRLGMLALMVCLDQAAEAKITTFLAALPEEARMNVASPERLVAPVFDQWLWKGDRPHGYTGGKTDDHYIDGDPTRAYTYWRVTRTSGRVAEEHFPFKRFADGWRYGPLTESDAEQLLALLDPATGQPKLPAATVPAAPPLP